MAVDPIIQQKAEDIRMKIYGEQVRESLASGLEAMSSDVVEVEGRQDEVEEQFQNVIENTTDKDIISAPELIAARNGEANLKARLDKENQEVTAQLAQKAEKEYTEAVNKRLDNLVVPLSPENANVEVTDSHVSLVKNKTFPSLPKRLEEAEREFRDLSDGSPLVNLIKNANFYDTSNWKSQRATLTAENNELKIDGNFEELETELHQQISVAPNHMYYLDGHVKTTSDKVCLTINSSLTWRDYHSGSGNYERLSTNYLTGEVTERLFQIIDERVSGAKDPIFASKFLLVDLTSAFGEGNEPTSDEMDEFLTTYYTDGWFSGGASLGGYFKYIESELKVVSQDIDEVSSKEFTVPVLETDPLNPQEGQMWIVKTDNALLREAFAAADGSLLNAATWDVIKTGNTHAAGDGVVIQQNQAQFTVGSADGGTVGVAAKVKGFKVDWSAGKRVITWEQQPDKWYGVWGLFLSNKEQVEGGTNLTDYAVRLMHDTENSRLQAKNAGQTAITYNQSFAHGATGDQWRTFRLEITAELIEVYMNEILQLSAPNVDIGVTSAWLYLYAETNNTAATIKRVDNVVIL